jgi:DNA helicase-2/ATP-dependent DNA helicase PcrA
MVLTDTQYKEMLQKHEMSEETASRIANIDELIQAAGESAQRGETIAEFLDRASLSSELDHLDPEARVALMTLHSAKGLEFDTVFLVGMEEGLFPHSRASQSDADLEEERRLCYVGITRARKKLFVTWTPFRKAYGPDAGFRAEMSRFLREMPEELVEGLDEIEVGEEVESYTRQPKFGASFSGFSGRSHEPRKHRTHSSHAGSSVNSYAKEKSRPREESVPVSDTVDTSAKPKSIAELKAYLEQKQKAAAPGRPPSAKESLDSGLRTGMRVRHEQFGDGILLSRERAGNDYKLTIIFSRVGKKSLIEKYAKLKPI